MEFDRAVIVFAHPDDAEFLCGGTVATWAKGGTDVHYVCATDGSAGWNGPDLTRDEIARIREAEMREAADVLGVRSVTFLGFVDGTLEPNLELRRAVTREVRRLRPDVLLTFEPTLWSGRRYVNHPDHRAIGEAVLAVVACDAPTRPQFPELLDEGLEPHKVPRLWLPTFDGADTFVDISDTIELKIEALHRHKSQMENMGMNDVDERIREWAADLAKEREVEYAEAFRTFELDEE
ncbi:MAG TPA: PIG-L deacetylase family protein [Actinomycetota bacterium]|nr:PIG-L deacetylase family protein [Actinomycetota bacterium]